MKRIINNIKNIIWLCNPYFRYGKLFLLLTLLTSLIYGPVGDFIYVRYPEMFISALSENKPFMNILLIAIFMSTLTWLNDMIPSFLYPYFTKKQEKINLKVKKEIYKKVLTVDYKYIDDPEYYETYSWAINEYVKQTYAAKDFLDDFSRYIASIVLLISLILETSPLILVSLIMQMILHILINLQMNKNSIDKKSELHPLERRLNYFHRLFYLKDYAGDMKATKLGEFILKRYDVTGEEVVGVISKYAIKTAFWSIMQETLFAVTEFVLVIYLAKSIIDGNIPEVGMYMTMMLAFYRVYSKLHQLVDVLQRANEISLNGENIKKFFDFESIIENQNNPNSIVASKKSFDIKFNNVCFSYEHSEFALKNFNLHIKAGEKVAIVGENGAGKTTLVKLLLRLYDTNSGEILLNDIPIQNYQLGSLRSSIGVAFQNTNIYAMSYADNLELYDSVSKEKMESYTQLLGLESVFKKNNADFESELTREFYKSGIMLSGGEAQKIALARVMTHKFGLLLLDEPSSALDPIAEYKMSEIILDAANKSTTIIVAHRLSMVRNVDKIIVMGNGTILEFGTHDELMAAQGKYYEMFTKQAENYIN